MIELEIEKLIVKGHMQGEESGWQGLWFSFLAVLQETWH